MEWPRQPAGRPLGSGLRLRALGDRGPAHGRFPPGPRAASREIAETSKAIAMVLSALSRSSPPFALNTSGIDDDRLKFA